jgi:transposase
VKIVHGYNKDHRPDCKQIVFGLNVTGDGHVPLSYQLYDGNQADVTTHIPNWEQLREVLGKEDFISVADSKLCSYENLSSIAANGGRFITVVPRNFGEVKDFLERVRGGEEIAWQDELSVPDSRKKGATQDYRIHVGERMGNGFGILWLPSRSKQRLEGSNRERAIRKAEEALEQLAGGLNRRSLKSREQIEAAIEKALQETSAYLTLPLQEERTSELVQVGRGRPGPKYPL